MRYGLIFVALVILLLVVLQPLTVDAGVFLSPPTEFVSPICKWHLMDAPLVRERPAMWLPLLLRP
jgi:hypothetical protein